MDPVEDLQKKLKAPEKRVRGAEKDCNKSSSVDDKNRAVLRVGVDGTDLAVNELFHSSGSSRSK